MKLGIDFGTTRIVVAAVDRGNYPLIPFETASFLLLIAAVGAMGRLYSPICCMDWWARCNRRSGFVSAKASRSK